MKRSEARSSPPFAAFLAADFFASSERRMEDERSRHDDEFRSRRRRDINFIHVTSRIVLC